MQQNGKQSLNTGDEKADFFFIFFIFKNEIKPSATVFILNLILYFCGLACVCCRFAGAVFVRIPFLFDEL